MVGAVDFVVDACRLDFVCQSVGDDEVVDAPAGVFLVGVEAVRPPGVCAFEVGVEVFCLTVI